MCTRQGNARYVVGHRPLWRAVITPWAPMCTFVARRRGSICSPRPGTTAFPADIPHEHLNGLTWNTRTIVGDIAAIPGWPRRSVAARRHATRLAKLLGLLAPDAELVDGEALMRGVRAVKLPAEIECLRTAIAMAEGALTTVAQELAAGGRPSSS